jgi:hypothetical protein
MALSMMPYMTVVALLMPFLVRGMNAADVPASQRIDIEPDSSAAAVGRKNKHPYSSPKNLFIQVSSRCCSAPGSQAAIKTGTTACTATRALHPTLPPG